MKTYLMKSYKTCRNGRKVNEKTYFPEFNAAFGTDLRLYEVSEVEGNIAAKIIPPRPESRKDVELYRFKKGESANVFAIRKEVLHNGVKMSRELIYNGYGQYSQYAQVCGDVVLIFSRHADSILAHNILVLPVFSPEKQFSLTVRGSNAWIQKSQISVKGGVLTIWGRHFRFICDEENDRFNTEEISKEEAVNIRAAAPRDDDAGSWIPAEFVGE